MSGALRRRGGVMSEPYTSLGELFKKYSHETNPVTRSVYRQIIANRLDGLEKTNDK